MQPELKFSEGLPQLVFPNGRELVADFATDPRYNRKLRGRSELIAKAVGLKPGTQVRVWDLSVGLGEDAWTLARLGCEVWGFERQELLAQWLQLSFEKFKANLRPESELTLAAARLHLERGNALEVLKQKKFPRPDVIYFDPMYGGVSQKSALPRIEMQMMRAWLGEDQDQAEVLEAVLGSGCARRIVVKRPHRAPELRPGVSHRFEGEKVRYDMYLNLNAKQTEGEQG